MYLHIGQEKLIRTRGIVGVFDMDTATVSRVTRDFLAAAQKRGAIREASPGELPVSFIVTDGGVHLSPVTAHTLRARAEAQSYV